MRTEIYGWRARVGYAGPSPLNTAPYEFWKMAPDGVAMVCTGLHIDADLIEGSEPSYAEVQTAALALDKFDLDFIALGVIPFYWSRLASVSPLLRKQLGSATKSRLLLPEDTICEAFNALDAKSIALVSPYGTEENAAIERFLAARGYRLTATVTADRAHNNPRYSGLHELCAPLAKEKSSDVIYVAGDRWPVAPHIERLESEFDIPVVGDIQALLASVLRNLNTKVPVKGFGKLLHAL